MAPLHSLENLNEFQSYKETLNPKKRK
jgi:hypothetical protein